MLKTFRLRHETRYHYDVPVEPGPQYISLIPMLRHAGRVVSQVLTFSPEPAGREWHTAAPTAAATAASTSPRTFPRISPVDEPLSRSSRLQQADTLRLAKVRFDQPVSSWSIVNTLILQLENPPAAPDWQELDHDAVAFPFTYPPEQEAYLRPYRHLPDPAPQLVGLLNALPRGTVPTRDAVDLITAAVGETALSGNEAIQLLADVFRAVKVAARFVTGYDPQREGRLCIWLQIYLPGTGWLDLDVHHGVFGAQARIAVLVSPDLKGTRPVSSPVSLAAVSLTTATTLEAIQPGLLNSDPGTEADARPGSPSSGPPSSGPLSSDLSLGGSKSFEALNPDRLTAPATRSEALAAAGEAVDRLLAAQNLKVSTGIEVETSEHFTKLRRTSWQDVVYDLRDRLKHAQSKVPALPESAYETAGAQETGGGRKNSPPRLHNIHRPDSVPDPERPESFTNETVLVQRARFFALAFPCLSRLIGKDRFDGPYLTAKDEALNGNFGGATERMFKTRHDMTAPFATLSNALLERALIARMAQKNSRFAPVSTARLNDAYRLPAVLEQDLAACCRWLSGGGLRLDPQWYAAHSHANFPLLWSKTRVGVALEIRPAYRNAVEQHRISWLEIRLAGDDKDRYLLAANGWTLPVRRVGEYKVCGLKLSQLSADFSLGIYDRWERKACEALPLRVEGGTRLRSVPPEKHDPEKHDPEKHDPEKHDPESPEPENHNKDTRVRHRFPDLMPAPANPDLLYSLDLAWAEYWGGEN